MLFYTILALSGCKGMYAGVGPYVADSPADNKDIPVYIELRRTVALVSDLLEGQETAYHKYTPAQFRHRLRTHWISERESMSRLMEKNIELQNEWNRRTPPSTDIQK
jgi:hypothetical protein